MFTESPPTRGPCPTLIPGAGGGRRRGRIGLLDSLRMSDPESGGITVGRIRVLVVDDHRIFAEALAAALSAEPDVEVAVAGSGSAAERALDRAAAEGRGFQVLLVDADLGGTADGIAAAARCRAAHPG